MNTASRTTTAAVFAALSLATLAPAGAQLAGQLGILDLEANGGINPATGEAWKHGDRYRFIFASSGTTQATSTDIATYNTFVQNAANASPLRIGAAEGVIWKAIASTAEVAARDNTSTNIDDFGPGEAIFLLDGVTLLATDYAALWGSNTHNGGINKTELLTEPPKVKQYGDTWTGIYRHAYPDPNYGTASANDELGALDGSAMCGLWPFNSGTHWVWRWVNTTDTALPLYALSDPLKVFDPSLSAGFPLAITPAATGYDFQWESQDGKLYDLVSSTDLSTPIATWPVWEGNADIEGAAPTNMLLNVPGGDPTRFFAVVEKNPPPLFEEDFESDNGGFTVATTDGTGWAWGDPDSSGEGGSVTTSNGESTKCWGTGISNPGFYANPTDTCLRSSVIDLTGVAAAELSFAQALDLDTGDSVTVNIIDDTTDTPISTNIVTITDTDINTADWESVGPVAIPVAALGQSVRIEWCLNGTGGTSFDFMGWYIDDVVVTETTP